MDESEYEVKVRVRDGRLITISGDEADVTEAIAALREYGRCLTPHAPDAAALAVNQADTAPESNPVKPAGSQAAPVTQTVGRLSLNKGEL